MGERAAFGRRSRHGGREFHMRMLCRVLGLIVGAVALALLARDLFVLVQSGSWAPIDVGALWWTLHPGSLQLAEPAIARHLHPFLWDPVMMSVLLSPAWLPLGLLAALLLLLGRRRSRRSRRFGS